jgi:imidazole glycerol-phosphate synthase subunit HisH
MGNLGSVKKAVETLGGEVFFANNPKESLSADKLILPGVGSFAQGMDNLNQLHWTEFINNFALSGKFILGICLGMQLLSTIGEEGGITNGLNLISGKVIRLDKFGCEMRIPHVGWNEVNILNNKSIFSKIPEGSDFYFVHSYGFQVDDEKNLIASSPYQIQVPAVIQKENIIGCQFHPEKSSKAGRQFLKNFLDL